jgi:uncharacterized membrane protein
MSLPPPPDGPGPGPAERLWQFVTLVSIGSLFAVFGLRRLFVVPDAASPGNLAVLALQALPLLAFVPAIVGGSARAAAFLAFVSIAYFVGAVLALVDPDGRLYGSALLLFSTTLFLGSTYYTRERGRRGDPGPRDEETGTD